MIKKISIILFQVILLSGLLQKLYSQCPACEYSADLITNGSFNSGNTGFSSDLNYVTGIFCPLCPENTYTVGINATFYHSDFTGSDHTNPPFGSFYIANGPGTAGVSVWCQSFAVQPGTDYTFTFWARDITNNSEIHPYALLQPSFNGILIDDTLEANGGWESFSMLWNSGTDTFLELCLLNQQSLTGGNDFGLDDISLTACQEYHLSQNANAGLDASTCSTVPLQIGQTFHNGYSYNWDNGTGLSSQTIASPTVTLQNSTEVVFSETYILTTDSAGVGCITSDTVVVTILPMPEFTLGPDTTICPGTLATLNAGDTWNSVLWSTSAEVPVIQVEEGNYSATVTFQTCSVTDEMDVFLTPMPELWLGPDTSFCEINTYILHANQDVTWSDNSISDSLIITQTGAYYGTYINGVCSISDTIVITMFQQPSIPLPSDTNFCEGTILTLNAGTTGLWNTGEISSSISINEEGYYDIVVDNGPCQTSAGTTAHMISLPILHIPTDTTLCEDFELFLDVQSNKNTYYIWSTGDSIASVYLYEAGTYQIETGNQCDTISSEINIETYPCNWGLFVPSCFTPNDDNINEGWIVQGYNVSNVQIYVYNRLGDLIFYAPDIGLPWNPSLSIGDDVYNYTILATAFDGEPVEQHGHVYLLR